MITTKEHIDRFFGLPMSATNKGEVLDKFDELVAEAITEAEAGSADEAKTKLQQAACVMHDTLHDNHQVDEDGNLL